jgi:hypothetical protein
MSLIKKADVKRHFAERRAKHLLLLSQPAGTRGTAVATPLESTRSSAPVSAGETIRLVARPAVAVAAREKLPKA